jgi:hypothetical protein
MNHDPQRPDFTPGPDTGPTPTFPQTTVMKIYLWIVDIIRFASLCFWTGIKYCERCKGIALYDGADNEE